jgi:hypothetical protein
MPYFKNNDVNLLFIHIPKTGGTSLEKYLSKKYNIKLNEESLYVCNFKKFGHSYHHCTYKEIINNIDFFKINIENLKIITIVRNPYERIVSELFYREFINDKNCNDQNFVYTKLDEYIKNEKKIFLDNHNIPQYEFLINDDGQIDQNIKIFYTENLKNQLNNYGFDDFDVNENKNNIFKDKGNINYIDFLNNDSIKLINEYYKKDFEFFYYKMIKI